jgi:hypothetical protein
MAIWAPLIAGGAALGGSIFSSIKGSGDQAKRTASQERQNEEAIKRFYEIEDPNYLNMMLNFEQLSQQGQLTPEEEAWYWNIQIPTMTLLAEQDERYLDPQLDALARLGNISNEGGLDAQAMSAIEQARMGNLAAARGAREANLTNAAQRGVAGSGLEFVSNQMADQNAANQGSLYGLQQAGMANERDLAALNQMANLAGTMSERDLGVEMTRAKAQDEINRFNAEMVQGVQQRNVAGRNVAQSQNLAEKQRIADQNIAIKNAQQQANAGIEQQKYNNKMAKATGSAGITTGTSDAMSVASQAAGNMWGGIGQGLAGTAGSLFANMGSKYKPTNTPVKKEDDE